MTSTVTTASAFVYGPKVTNAQGFTSWQGRATGTYSGLGEFYSGIRDGDLVTITEERGEFEGRSIEPRYIIQGIGSRAGASLSFYGTVIQWIPVAS